jgi:transposase-like protein
MRHSEKLDGVLADYMPPDRTSLGADGEQPPSLGHRLFLRTNNALERVNQEIKRRTRVVRIFPNEESCLRLVSALCVETSEEWMTNRRFLDMDALREMLEADWKEGVKLTAVS